MAPYAGRGSDFGASCLAVVDLLSGPREDVTNFGRATVCGEAG